MRTTALFLLIVCSAASFTLNQSQSGEVTTVLALEHAWNQAEQRGDTKSLDAIFENSMVYVDYDGSIYTKAEFLLRLRLSSSHVQQEVTDAMTARRFGDTVVVTGLYSTKGVENGKPFARRGRFVDTWVLKDGKWLCVASQATPLLR